VVAKKEIFMNETEPTINKWLITLTVMTATIMSAVDISIVNVALPYMRGNFGASVEEITWVATGYLLSNVVVMPMVAMLTARFGRRRFYLFSIILFTITSMLCGLSWNLSSLIAFRVLQGIGGGAIIPISQAILRESFPTEEQGKIIGIYGLGVILGPAFSPTLGGWLTDAYSWRWIFFINVPVGVLTLALISRYIHDPHYLVRDKGRLDYWGLALLTIGLSSLQLLLEKGERWQWFDSWFIVWLTVLAGVGMALFVWRELTITRPAVDLRLFTDFNFTIGTLFGGVFGIALYGSLFLLPLFLQEIVGYSALNSGLTMMPRSLAMAFTMPLAGRLYNRTGPRALVGIGMLISSFSFWQLSQLTLGVGFWDIFVPQALQGVGFGLVFVSLTTSAMITIDRCRMTSATGLYVVVRQVCGSIGIALVATLLARSQAPGHTTLAEHLTPYWDAAVRWLAGLSAVYSGHFTISAMATAKALNHTTLMTGRQAALLAFNHVFLLLALLFLVSFPLTFLLQSGRKRLIAPVEGTVVEPVQ
jgi:DHA2 family multidrug resistance protein